MSLNVAVTGLHAADNPAPGIGVIRCLHHPERWGGKIIGLAYDALDTGIYDEGLLGHAYLIPYPNSGSQALLERLLYIHEQQHIDVIIPTLDSELPVFQKLEQTLKSNGIAMFIPPKQVTDLISKAKLADLCEKVGIPFPETKVIKEPGELKDAVKEIGFPLMIKGIYYEAYTCNTLADVQQNFDKIRLKWGLPIILQKKIESEEFDVCCVCDENSDLLGAVPIRKTRLTDKGKAWAAVTLRNKQLLELSANVLKHIRWIGPCEVEILKNVKTGEYNLIEINPRFPAWIYLCTGADQNLPRLVVELARGKSLKPLEIAKSGICFVRHAIDLVCPLDYIENLTTLGELHFSMSKEH